MFKQLFIWSLFPFCFLVSCICWLFILVIFLIAYGYAFVLSDTIFLWQNLGNHKLGSKFQDMLEMKICLKKF